MRRRTLLPLTALIASLALAATPAAAPAQTIDDICAQASPLALPCVGAAKVGEAIAAECRRLGLPDSACVLPLGRKVLGAVREAYLRSWTHRAAQFQYSLQDSLPLGQVQWLGTHNSFNSVNDTITLSHTDSNQQMSLTHQLDIDIRALEIDIHLINGVATVCHGQGPDVANLGCTTEGPLSAVLPEIAKWLNAPEHRDQVILLYVEDGVKNTAAFGAIVSQFDSALRRPDGSSLIYRPDQSKKTAAGCVTLPRSISRNTVRKAGAQIVMVGNCVKGWAADVHNWSPVEAESGDAAAYRPFPACDATYKRDAYDAKLIRYFEDSTFIATVTDPFAPVIDPGRLTVPKVAAMMSCGVNLFGFDQLLPDDGRITASIFSWATDQPDTAAGTCAAQRGDARWLTQPCARRIRAACVRPSGKWRLTRKAVRFSGAKKACRSVKASFRPPRTGYQNSLVRQIAGTGDVWLNHKVKP